MNRRRTLGVETLRSSPLTLGPSVLGLLELNGAGMKDPLQFRRRSRKLRSSTVNSRYVVLDNSPRLRDYVERSIPSITCAMSAPLTAPQPPTSAEPEMAFVWFCDIVGYSKLPLREQRDVVTHLQSLIESTSSFQKAAASGNSVRLPTGDGVALAFLGDAEAPFECAREVSTLIRQQHATDLRLRIGIHAGLVTRFRDINGNVNLSGGGVNIAQRVMDCADSDHILVSGVAARLISDVSDWSGLLHRLGWATVKHSVRVEVFNFFGPDFGNATLPQKLNKQRRKRRFVVGLPTFTLAAAVVVLAWLMFSNKHEPRLEQLTFNPPEQGVNAAAVSPDGKYLAFVDPEGFFIRSIGADEVQTIPVPESLKKMAGSFEWSMAWFPNSQQLLLDGPESANGDDSIWEFSLVDRRVQLLRQHAQSASISSNDEIAFIDTSGDTSIWTMKGSGEDAHQVLAPREGESFWTVVWSPHGKRLACITQRADADLIEAIDPSGTRRELFREKDLVMSTASDFGTLFWAEGSILFARREGGASYSNLWKLKVDEGTGKRSGEPIRITKEAGFYFTDVSASADARNITFIRTGAYFTVLMGHLQGTSSGLDNVRSLIYEQHDYVPTGWSADSSELLFGKEDAPRRVFHENVQTLARSALVSDRHEEQAGAVPSPGGTNVLFWSWPLPSDTGVSKLTLKRVPWEGGIPHTVLQSDHSGTFRCPRLGRECLLSTYRAGQLAFSSFDAETGKTRSLGSIPVPLTDNYLWDISPSGETVALVASQTAGEVSFYTVHGTSLEKLRSFGPVKEIENVSWTADNRSVLLSVYSGAGSRLLRADTYGHTTELWNKMSEIIGSAIPSPDGSSVAMALTRTAESNVWELHQ